MDLQAHKAYLEVLGQLDHVVLMEQMVQLAHQVLKA